ncbi:MAG: hypothetical protein KatS3mg102_0134 [Planctomycetota bacterium]|nr:MAG: hypothetical protein KatS3mg102_0134 [Planctomycetota bacterium]
MTESTATAADPRGALAERLERLARCGRRHGSARGGAADGAAARPPCDDELLCPWCARRAADRAARHALDTWGPVCAVRLVGPPGARAALRAACDAELQWLATITIAGRGAVRPRWVEGFDHVWLFFPEALRPALEDRYGERLVSLSPAGAGEELRRTWLSVHEAAMAAQAAAPDDPAAALAGLPWLTEPEAPRTGGGTEACAALGWVGEQAPAAARALLDAARPQPDAPRRLPVPARRPERPPPPPEPPAPKNLEQALGAYRTALAVAEALVEQKPEHMPWQRDVLFAYRNIARTLRALGRPDEARQCCAQALVRSHAALALDATNPEVQRALAALQRERAATLAACGELREATEALRQELAIQGRLVRLAPDPDHPALQRELLEANLRLGALCAELGDDAQALAAYGAAADVAERMAALRPQEPVWQRELAAACELAGHALAATGQLAQAREALQSAYAAYELLAAAEPAEPAHRFGLHRTRTALGQVLQRQGALEAAREVHGAALALATRQAALQPDAADWHRAVAASHEHLAEVALALGDAQAAYEACKAAVLARDAVARREHAEARWQRELLLARLMTGDVLRAQGDERGALATYRAALPLAQALWEAAPDDPERQRDLAIAEGRLGDMWLAQGAVGEALAHYRRALERSEALCEAAPSDPRRRADLAAARQRVGDALRARGDLEEALAAYRAALAGHRELAEQAPDDHDAQRQVMLGHLDCGELLAALGDWPAAYEQLHAALELAQELFALDPDPPARRRDLAICQERLGEVLLAEGDLSAALRLQLAALAVREGLLAERPEELVRRRDVAASRQRLGEVYMARGEAREAIENFRAALALREDLVRREPTRAPWLYDLALGQRRLAAALAASLELEPALALARAAVASAEQLAQLEPGNASWLAELAACREQVREIERTRAELPEAGTRERIHRLQREAARFDVIALLEQLRRLGYDADDILFRSNPLPTAQSSLVHGVEFLTHPVRQVVVTLNMGLLTPFSPLPSYFQKIIDQAEIDEQAFLDFLGFFDHWILQSYLGAAYPERNPAIYPRWEETKRHYLQLLGLRAPATLYWLFRLAFPELGLQVQRCRLGRALGLEPARLGHAALGGAHALGGRTDVQVTGFEIVLYADDEQTDDGRAWPEEVARRLQELLFPLLRDPMLELLVRLVIRTQKGWARLTPQSYLGFDRIRGGPETARTVIVHQGPVPRG